MSSNAPSNSSAPYLPTSIYFPQDFEQMRIKLLSTYTNIAINVNARQLGIYDLTQNVTGQQWFVVGDPQSARQTFRKVFSIGSIAAGVTSTTAHGLTNLTAFTSISGTAVTASSDYRPIPYASATAVNQQIEIKVDATNITIINGAASPVLSSSIVVLEYLLQ
jgi:hypothetical protein